VVEGVMGVGMEGMEGECGLYGRVL
jgi:hypothetical protein